MRSSIRDTVSHPFAPREVNAQKDKNISVQQSGDRGISRKEQSVMGECREK